jgi:hypothetical protein
MTPEERARADAIMEEITKQAKARRQHAAAPAARIPGITSEPPTPTGHGLRYAALFAVIAALHVAGFIAYDQYTQKKEAEKIAQIKAEAEAATQEGIIRGQIEAERMRQLFSQIAPVPQAQPKPSPKIEYTATRQQPTTRPQIQQPQAYRPPARPQQTQAPAKTDPTEEHKATAEKHAYSHFRYKYKIGSKQYAVTSLQITSPETSEVTGWDRYRTLGEAGIEYYDNQGLKRTTRRFEVLTEIKNGKVTPVDITVKL